MRMTARPSKTATLAIPEEDGPMPRVMGALRLEVYHSAVKLPRSSDSFWKSQ